MPLVAASEPDARLLVGADGTVLARFRRRPHTGAPFAGRFEPVAAPERVERAVRDELGGWRISTHKAFAQRLLAVGAELLRHGHLMSRDLLRDPAPAAWADPPAPPGFTLTPLDRPAADLMPAYRAAFPPGHPDHADVGDHPDELDDLISGRKLGPLLGCSGLAVDASGAVAAAVFVNVEPEDGPLVSLVFRRPDAPGTGGALLRRALGLATRHGQPALSLWVSHANPARAVYARLRFAELDESLTVKMPGGPAVREAPGARS